MSQFRGTPATHENPGTYSVRRHLTSETYAATMIDFRRPEWMGACTQLTAEQSVDAQARGEVRRVTVRLVSGTEIRVSDHAGSGDQYSSADGTARIVQMDFGNWQAKYAVWFDSNAGAVALEVETYFDIPADGDV